MPPHETGVDVGHFCWDKPCHSHPIDTTGASRNSCGITGAVQQEDVPCPTHSATPCCYVAEFGQDSHAGLPSGNRSHVRTYVLDMLSGALSDRPPRPLKRIDPVVVVDDDDEEVLWVQIDSPGAKRLAHVADIAADELASQSDHRPLNVASTACGGSGSAMHSFCLSECIAESLLVSNYIKLLQFSVSFQV